MDFYSSLKEEQIKYVAKQLTREQLGSVIDHTNLNPYATKSDIEKLCKEAKIIGSSICIHPARILDAKTILNRMDADYVKIASVIGFPLGSSTYQIKVTEAVDAVELGSDEIDVVLNIGYLKDGDERFGHELEGIFKRMTEYDQPLVIKVIQENCYLSKDEKIVATRTTTELGRKYKIHAFAKTSTGFGTPKEGIPKGATIEDVKLMREVIGEYDPEKNKIGIKPAGGIKDAKTSVEMMIVAGCITKDGEIKENLKDRFRIGTSSGFSLVNDLEILKEKI